MSAFDDKKVDATIDGEMHKRALLVFPVVILAAALVACSKDDERAFTGPIIVEDRPVEVQLVYSEMVVGRNRFVIGLLDIENRPIVDARVRFKFYDLNGPQPEARFEAEGVSRVPARDAGIEEQVVHIHADGSRHVHVNVSDEVGVYTAWVEFDRPGVWGVEISMQSKDGKLKETLRPRFTVLPAGQTPAIGQPAPKSRQRLLVDVDSIEQIDSAANPEPDFHRMTVAEAVEAGRPALVFFAVPGYCDSRFCGPEYEIMRKLLDKHRGRLEFMHIEFYKVPGSPERQPVDAVAEWGLRSEPWFFLIDSNGLIAAKFEGPTSFEELEEAILSLG
jgi:hypothetical protein